MLYDGLHDLVGGCAGPVGVLLLQLKEDLIRINLCDRSEIWKMW